MKKLIGSICLVCSLLVPVNIHADEDYILDVSTLIDGKLPVNKLNPRVIGEDGAIVESISTFDFKIYNQSTQIGELSNLKTILEGWQSRTMELIEQINTADVKQALIRNKNLLKAAISIIENPMDNHFGKMKYFTTSFMEEGVEAKPLSMITISTMDNDGIAYLEAMMSEPDNLVKTYMKKPGGIKRAAFHNLSKAVNYLIEEEQISNIEAYPASEEGEWLLRNIGFKVKKTGC